MQVLRKVPTMLLELLPHGTEMKNRLRVRQSLENSLYANQKFEEYERLNHQSARYRMLWIACVLFGLGVGLIVDGLASSVFMLPLMVVLVPLPSGWVLGKMEDGFWENECATMQTAPCQVDA